MPSERLYEEIQSLERKIRLMINENERLKEDLFQSRDENGSLKAELKSREANMNSFQNQMKINKLVNNMVAGEGESEELEKTLDSYIKEIDKCIAHLTK